MKIWMNSRSIRKNSLVAGGAGFLGAHLCRRLIAAHANVVCVDNLQTGRRNDVADLDSENGFRFLEHDVTDRLDADVDEIYNFACPASPLHYQKDPIGTAKTTVIGAINLLELALQQKAKILQASTSEVYGDPTVHPQSEEYWGNVNPIGPRACYDESKRCAETLFFDFWRRNGVPIKVVRIFNTYGPGMRPDDGRVVSNFIVQALRGQEITVYGDGQQTRSFCYIDDMIDGIVRMMRSPDEVVGPFNLGNPTEFTIRELAELVLQLTGSKSRIASLPLPIDDPRQRKPDIAKAKALLGWQPQVELHQGLAKTIDYFDALLAQGLTSSR
jgi:UDP-glucuronate decarboxylase